MLEAFHGESKLTMLHLHGEELMFDELASYPSHVLNWYDRFDGLSLRAARTRTTKCLAGGIDHERNLVLGMPDEIAAEVREAIAQLGGRGLILARLRSPPDRLPGESPSRQEGGVGDASLNGKREAYLGLRAAD